MINSEKLKDLPENPGVYIMKDDIGNIIYIGKARNLKNRVKQYFNSSEKAIKVAAMVENAADFELIVTDTEMEALILECNLIKKHMPRFNIMLRDDKNYPFIKVTTNETYPRVVMTREVKKDGAKYFGPFTSVNSVKHTIDLLNKTYSLKRCKKRFDNGKIDRPCLHYHIEQCKGICQGKADIEEYRDKINEIIQILNGRDDKIIERLQEKMKKAAKDLEFEEAAQLRDQVESIKMIMEKQKVVSNSLEDQDVLAFYLENMQLCIQVFFVRKGKLLGRENFFYEGIENGGDFLMQFVKQFYHNASFVPKEILLQMYIEDADILEEYLTNKKGSRVYIRVPKKGNKKDLVKMVEDNAKLALEEHKQKMLLDKVKQDMSYNWLMENLSLNNKPHRIEAYDISNIKGTDSVGSMVVYEDLKANKKAYRRFKIKSVEGPNDYGSMQEIVFRRIERGLKELQEGEMGRFSPLPDIILLDGGLGHINAVKTILEQYSQLSIPICGLVKDDRHRLRELIYEGQSISIPSATPVYYLLNNISEEVHRFAISYHKKIRTSNMLKSDLDSIPGIGRVKRNALLKHFKNIRNIRKSSKDELLQVEGISDKIADNIVEYFKT